MNADNTPKIRVLIRKRPMNKKQQGRNEIDIIQVQNNQTVIVRQQKVKVDLTPFIDQYKFNFDGAFDQFATNQQIYANSIRPLVDCAFDGARVSCFAYGQTGSGKTHTMLGNGADVRGLYFLAALDIFQELNNYPDIEVWISFYEIYCGKLYDLLNQKNLLYARQDAKNNVNIVGLSETKIQNAQSLIQIIEYGTGIRVTSQNGTNNDSSRSHAILQIGLKKKNKMHGKIVFIDLAGSERAADHADQLQKQTRIDGAEINKSLLALKECIRALDQNKHHTPFRGSKLTMVLKDSFTGYCRTVMIGNIAPNSSSSQNTLNTLKYADRVKQLKKPNKQNFIQMQKIDQLQKQLMLPRAMNNKKSKSVQVQQQNYKHFRQNINANIQPHHNEINPKMKLTNQKKLNNINMNNFMINNHSQMSSPIQKPYPKHPHTSHMQNMPRNPSTLHESPKSSYPKHSPPRIIQSQHHQSPNYNNIHQSKNPKPTNTYYTEQDLLVLSQRHQLSVQKILEEEEELLKYHQDHINTTIELTKKEMIIKSDADKIGSSIDDYLADLSNVLQHKLSSIFMIKDKIQTIKIHLKQSKSLEEQYLICSRSINLHQQDEDNIMLLDDDDCNELFHN